MKKCYSLLRWPCLLQDVLNRRLLAKQTGSNGRKGSITHHFFVSGIEQEETVDAAKICGGAENVVKTETSQHSVNGLLQFYYFRHLYSAGKRVCIAHHCMSCPSIWATLSALLINILLGSFQLFLHSSQPLSEVEIIPFSGVCQSGGCISTPEAMVASRTD